MKIKEGPDTLAPGRLSYTQLENHQQNVYSLDDVVQKDFFSVSFHEEKFKKGVEDFINNNKSSFNVSEAVEINKEGEELISTRCTVCHYLIGGVKNSFIDVQLYRKLSTENQKIHKDYQDWLLSYADDNPFAAAVTQLVILRNRDTDMPEAIFFPTVSNCPDRGLVSNLIIALRQCTEDARFIEHYKTNRELGLSRRASSYIPAPKLRNSNHGVFSYQIPVFNRYFNHPSYAAEQVGPKFTPRCGKHCWGHDDSAANVALLDNITESEKE